MEQRHETFNFKAGGLPWSLWSRSHMTNITYKNPFRWDVFNYIMNFNQTWQAHYCKRPFVCHNWDAKSQISRSHKAEDRFGRLTEASFSTPLGRLAFLFCFCCHTHGHSRQCCHNLNMCLAVNATFLAHNFFHYWIIFFHFFTFYTLCNCYFDFRWMMMTVGRTCINSYCNVDTY